MTTAAAAAQDMWDENMYRTYMRSVFKFYPILDRDT